MEAILDSWIVILAFGWALWVVYRGLTKKSFFSCSSPCKKKIFDKKPELLTLRRKSHLS